MTLNLRGFEENFERHNFHKKKNYEDLSKQLGQNLAITNKFPVIRCSWFLFRKILLDQI